MKRPVIFALLLTRAATGAWADRYSDCLHEKDPDHRIRTCMQIVEREQLLSKKDKAFAYYYWGLDPFTDLVQRYLVTLKVSRQTAAQKSERGRNLVGSVLIAEQPRDLQGQRETGDIGVQITMEDNILHVVAMTDEAPAVKAGIQVNDRITNLDGESVAGLSLEQVINMMRGDVDTSIILTITRQALGEPLDVKVVREAIGPTPVSASVEGDVGYIKLSTFNEWTHVSLTKAVESLKKSAGEELKGYILDLRNNPGGLFDQAVAVSDDFLESGVIVRTKGRNRDEVSQAHPGDLTKAKKVIVLINGASAAAAEIVAGALQDHKRATIVGTPSLGHGTIQSVIGLGDNGAIRLTTARAYTPSNRTIHGRGIKPDIVVEAKFARNEKRDNASASVPFNTRRDRQLQYALGLLRTGGEVDRR